MVETVERIFSDPVPLSNSSAFEASCARSVIVNAAREAIARTRAAGIAVDRGTVRRLLKVAREEPQFLLGGWIDRRCGCLVGNAFSRMQLPDQKDWQDIPGYLNKHEAIDSVGLYFDCILTDLYEAELGTDVTIKYLVVADA